VSKKIRITHRDQKPGAIALFVETKNLFSTKPSSKEPSITSEASKTNANLEKQ